jgi:hypothetical protein
MSGRRLGHRPHVLAAETVQRDPLDTLQTAQVRQRRGQRMILTQIGVAVGHQQLQRPMLEVTRDVFEQRHRLPVRPMEIIEHHTQRDGLRDRPQQLDHGLEQQEPLRLRIRAS